MQGLRQRLGVGLREGWSADALVDRLARDASSTWLPGGDTARGRLKSQLAQEVDDLTLRMLFRSAELRLSVYQQPGSGLPLSTWAAFKGIRDGCN